MSTNNILEVKELNISYSGKAALKEVSFSLSKGESSSVIGESGSGKTTLLKAIDGILGKEATITGEIVYYGHNLLSMADADRRKLMGGEIALIFQNPEGFFDPIRKIGRQMEDAIMLHQNVSRKAAGDVAFELLNSLSFSDVKRILNSYPFELSGGMCQRVAIAMAAGNNATRLILADEPTSALDQTIRKDAAQFIADIREKTDAALLLVTHDLRLAEQITDTIGVMYQGKLIERGSKQEILKSPAHPYTKSLISAIPQKGTDFSGYERFQGDCNNYTEKVYLSDTHWVLK